MVPRMTGLTAGFPFTLVLPAAGSLFAGQTV